MNKKFSVEIRIAPIRIWNAKLKRFGRQISSMFAHFMFSCVQPQKLKSNRKVAHERLNFVGMDIQKNGNMGRRYDVQYKCS